MGKLKRIGCIYHAADMDGKCSAAIVQKKFGDSVCFIAANYGDNINLTKIAQMDMIFVVDFSFDEMLTIPHDKLVWIDHHKSAMDKYPSELAGVRKIGVGACKLVWEYLFPHKKIPKIVKYIEDYDVWRFSLKDTLKIHYALGMFQEFDPKWFSKKWLFWRNMAKAGNVIIQYVKNRDQQEFDRYAYTRKEVTWCNIGHPLPFVKCKTPYLITYAYDGEKYNYSIRPSNSDLDVSVIASAMGGGGHKGAAGWYEYSEENNNSKRHTETVIEYAGSSRLGVAAK